MIRPCKPTLIERKNTRLKHQSEQSWVAEKPAKKLQRGGGAKAPPFVSAFESCVAPKILRTAA